MFSSVWIRSDDLQNRPFRVMRHTADLDFVRDLRGKETTIHISRMKPAFLVSGDHSLDNSTTPPEY